MKPHKLKKFKTHTEFRKNHGGLNMLQTYAVAQIIAQRIAADPDKLDKFVTVLSEILDEDKA